VSEATDFPIMAPPPGCPERVPWAFVAPHEGQALANHEQDLTQLARRGGLDTTELLAVLEDRPWHPVGRLDAAARVVELLAAWRRARA
jgi:hypothetical protein